MTERYEVDEYVRRLAPISDGAIAELIDKGHKARLFERITAPDGPDRTVPAPRRWRTRLALAAAAAGVLLAGGAVAVVAADPFDSRGSVASRVFEPSPAPGAESSSQYLEAACATPGGQDTAFAFDGTVIEISADPAFFHLVTYVEVTFQVHEWIFNEGTDEFTVVMPAPGSRVSSIDIDDYQVGSRLLVAADWGWTDRTDYPVSGFCAIHAYSPHGADEWRRNFGVD